METQKNNGNVVLNLKRQIGKMLVQVDFLYRNGREMTQFDYDILMDRTRELYEYLIDSQAENVNFEQDAEKADEKSADNDVEFEIATPETRDEVAEEPEEDRDDEDLDDEDWEDEEDVTFSVEPLSLKTDEVEEEEAEIQEETVVQEEVAEEPLHEDVPEDNSLAARLQRQPVTDIKDAIMLNDRIMMINDLFKGSSERYTKAVNELNEFPTLGGALVYMSELRVEFQWDVESEAYLKLKELVERRFL
ncbi:MAG: hypothetical protein MJZ90_09470 [Bacteroidales bacterium]|nr:hypothetical protein [Bacteroidales bacterium]